MTGVTKSEREILAAGGWDIGRPSESLESGCRVWGVGYALNGRPYTLHPTPGLFLPWIPAYRLPLGHTLFARSMSGSTCRGSNSTRTTRLPPVLTA